MTQLSDDSNMKTIELIDRFLVGDKETSEIIERRSILFKDVIEYVIIINQGLFSWQASTDSYLKKRKLGSVKIEFDKEQTIFSSGDEFVAKEFKEILATMTVNIVAKRHFLLKAKIYFWYDLGKFLWESGREAFFYSERHLAMRDRKFGVPDIYDLFSIFNIYTKYINGQFQILPCPADVINEELRLMFLDHLMADIRD